MKKNKLIREIENSVRISALKELISDSHLQGDIGKKMFFELKLNEIISNSPD